MRKRHHRKISKTLLREVNRALKGTGYTFDSFSADSVGVQGEVRVHGPTVFVAVPPNTTPAEWGAIATHLINHVWGITRVLAIVKERS